VRIRARGHYDEQITVLAVANELTPRHVLLRPKPARLTVAGSAGAVVTIDGQARARVPTGAPLEIAPGVHAVAVTLRGHEPYSALLDLGRDESKRLSVDLAPTPQRIAAWTVLAAGAGGAVASGVLAGLALGRQGEAADLEARRQAGALLPDERDRYNDAVGARNDLAMAAALTGGAAVLALATGVGLYVLDNPEALPPPPGRERKGAPAEPKPRTEFTVGMLSLGVRGAF
jgi:hypothetical protein